MSKTASDRGSIAYVLLLTLVAALGGLLFGYDTAVISGAIGFLTSHFKLDPSVEAGWAAASALAGCALGAGFAGLLSDRFGRKKMLILAGVLFFVSAVGTATPPDNEWGFSIFVLFRIIGGVAIGAASITSPMYIAEISPARIRGRLVSVNQLAIVSGILVVYFVNYFIGSYGTSIDRKVVAERTGSAGVALEPSFVTEYLAKQFLDEKGQSKETGGVDREAIAALVAQAGGKLDSTAVAKFMAARDKKVDPSAVDLAAMSLPQWNEEHGWRWMFGSGISPALVFLLLLLVVPESPRWLTKQGRESEAMHVLTRVGGAEQARTELRDIKDAIAHETGSIGQLFEPGMRIVLVIGVALAILQQVTGINVFLYFAPEIFKKIGSGSDAALLQTVYVGAVNLIFTVVAIWTVDRLGRKPLMLIGSAGMGISLLAMGLSAYFQMTGTWLLFCILGYIACFALSVGPVVWVILSEIFPTRIRGRAMAIATVCLWVANYIVTQTFTMMNESPRLVEMFHRAFPFWVYGSLCLVMLLFVWRFVPETKGKTLEEIERSWLPGGTDKPASSNSSRSA